MKKQLFTLLILFIGLNSRSQSNGFNYKALITNNGNALHTQSVSIKFTVLQNGTTSVYQETQTTTTDNNGILSVSLGEGSAQSGSFANIDWTQAQFLKVEINTGSGFTDFGTSELKYVPYAKYADQAGNTFSGSFTDLTNVPVNLDIDNTDDATQLNDLSDAKTTNTSVFLGIHSGLNENTYNRNNVGVGKEVLYNNTNGSNNTAAGSMALFTNTVGIENNAFGSKALYSNTTGDQNSAIGGHALFYNTIGYRNIAIGSMSLYQNTNGNNNIGLGYNGLKNNTTGSDNIGIGKEALLENLTGTNNVAVGSLALSLNTGNNNVAIGNNALYTNFNHSGLVAVGTDALKNNGNAATANEAVRNTAIGHKAMSQNGKGSDNTSVGYFTLSDNTNGNHDTAIGSFALTRNTTGNGNTVLGSNAMFFNEIGSYNTAVGLTTLKMNNGNLNSAFGYGALFSNTTGGYNTALGANSLNHNTTGFQNVAIGHKALSENTNLSNLVAVGFRALANNGQNATTSYHARMNTAVGFKALEANTNGYLNTAVGYLSISVNTTGYDNTAIGVYTLKDNTTGNSNSALGRSALAYNTNGNNNTAIGSSSTLQNTTGFDNTAVGAMSLYNNDTGYKNTAIGNETLKNITTGKWNTAVGNDAYITGNYDNSTAIGDATAVTASSQMRFGHNVSSIGGPVGWTNVSDARFKTNVQEDVPGLSFIMQLRPVTYHLDTNAMDKALQIPKNARKSQEAAKLQNMLQTGFIAQEVEQSAQNLGYEFSGVDAPKNPNDYYGLRYAEFTVPLVKAVQEQQKIITQQADEIQALKKMILSIKKDLDNLKK